MTACGNVCYLVRIISCVRARTRHHGMKDHAHILVWDRYASCCYTAWFPSEFLDAQALTTWSNQTLLLFGLTYQDISVVPALVIPCVKIPNRSSSSSHRVCSFRRRVFTRRAQSHVTEQKNSSTTEDRGSYDRALPCRTKSWKLLLRVARWL
jgi:hypothetical protein